MENSTLNVYRINPHPQTNGWVILCIVLGLIIVALLIVWPLTLNNCENQCVGCTCYGSYGVQSQTDGVELNLCGTGRNEPCTFPAGSLAECENICDIWNNICQAFSYDSRRLIMKIVQINNTFTSSNNQTNLFVRQSGIT